MAKTIKFNLICDEKPIRTIEDLQENFSIEDVLKYYNNGLLVRWLNVRGYNVEAGKVSSIESEKALDVIKELIKIFNIEADEKKIEEGVYILQYLEESKECVKLYSENSFKTQEILADYQSGYQHLVDEIMDNPDNVAIIKANISEMVDRYSWAMALNHREFFWQLIDKSYLAVMCLLMNEKTRHYYLPVEIGKDELSNTVIYDIQDNVDKRNMYKKICEISKESNFVEHLGENVHVFSGVTDGYWKDLETKEKKYMIISMKAGNFVRAAGLQGGDLASTDIVDKFVIISGVDYKSNFSYQELVYMEV